MLFDSGICYEDTTVDFCLGKMYDSSIMKEALKFAFKRDIPVMLGYIFMGIAFGLMLQDAGYSFVWAFFISLTCYAGTMQFVLVSLLTGGAGLLSTAVMTFSINSRHIFYGLSFLKKFKEMGKAYPYMIFSLTDETYALLCGTRIPFEIDSKKTMFFMAALNQSYWVIGCTAGALFGSLISFDTTGVDFAMTALFVVIFVDQWREAKTHIPVFIGIGCGLVSLLIIGPDNFIIPALAAAIGLLIACRRPIEGGKKSGGENTAAASDEDRKKSNGDDADEMPYAGGEAEKEEGKA